PDLPSQRDHAAVPPPRKFPLRYFQFRLRIDLVRPRACQENLIRRRRRPIRHADFQRGGRGTGGRPGRWLDRGLRLRAPTLLRFLRLHRHGDWLGADDRRASAAQFRLALQGAVAGRFLAALAHDAVEVPARLSLYPARRQSKGTTTALYQSLDHDAAGRLVARCSVDLRDLGRHSWLWIGRKSRLEQGGGLLSFETAQSGGLGTHARFRDAGVGSVSSR